MMDLIGTLDSDDDTQDATRESSDDDDFVLGVDLPDPSASGNWQTKRAHAGINKQTADAATSKAARLDAKLAARAAVVPK